MSTAPAMASSAPVLFPMCRDRFGIKDPKALTTKTKGDIMALADIVKALEAYKAMVEMLVEIVGFVDKLAKSKDPQDKDILGIYNKLKTVIGKGADDKEARKALQQLSIDPTNADDMEMVSLTFKAVLNTLNTLPDIAIKNPQIVAQRKGEIVQLLLKISDKAKAIRGAIADFSPLAKKKYAEKLEEKPKNDTALGRISFRLTNFILQTTLGRLTEGTRAPLLRGLKLEDPTTIPAKDYEKTLKEIGEVMRKFQSQGEIICNPNILDLKLDAGLDELPLTLAADRPARASVPPEPVIEFIPIPELSPEPPRRPEPKPPASSPKPIVPPKPQIDWGKVWADAKAKFQVGANALGGFALKGAPAVVSINAGFDVSDNWDLQFEGRSATAYDVLGANNLYSNSDDVYLLARYQEAGERPLGAIFGGRYFRSRSDYPSTLNPNLKGGGTYLHLVAQITRAVSFNAHIEGLIGSAETVYTQGENAPRDNTQYFPPAWREAQTFAGIEPSMTYIAASGRIPITVGAYAAYGEIEQGFLLGGLVGAGYNSSSLRTALFARAYGNSNYFQAQAGVSASYKLVGLRAQYRRLSAFSAVEQDISAAVGFNVKLGERTSLQPHVRGDFGFNGQFDLGAGFSFVYGAAPALSLDPNTPNSLAADWRRF